MKYILKITAVAFAALLGLNACDKVDSLPSYANGTGPVALTASAATIAPTAADENNVVLSFNWTDPKYAQDAASYKYVIQMDSTGKNFSNPVTLKTVNGALTAGMTGKALNDLFLVNLDYPPTRLVDMEIRVKSSYGNNNEQYTSNTVRVKITPYVPPMPTVAAQPATLPPGGEIYIVGDATPGQWNNPVPTPSQKFTKISNTFYQIQLAFDAGKEFLVLPVNGSWSNKYAVQDNTVAGIDKAGYFGYNVGSAFNANFKGPLKAGNYLLRMDFATGYFVFTKMP